MTTGTEVPQADRLDLVRRLVVAVANGASSLAAAAVRAHLAPRYAGYAAQAARQLGLLESSADAGLQLTATAKQLLTTTEGSPEERQLFRSAFAQSPTLSTLAAIVLADSAPSRTALAETIALGWPLSPATALRRATTLLTWRAYILQEGEQLTFFGPEWDEVLVDIPEGSSNALTISGEAVSVHRTEGPATDGEPARPSVADLATVQASLEALADSSTQEAGDGAALPDAIAPPDARTVGVVGAPMPAEPSAGIDGASDAVAASVPAPTGAPVVPPSSPESGRVQPLSEHNLAYFERQLRLGNLVLFTGAGFSLGARDSRGRQLPMGSAVATELWTEAFPGEAYDNSSLQDIFEALNRSNPKRLTGYLKERFSIDSGTLPAWYRTWFAMPWLKVYTLNIDNLETAAALRFDLPREPRPISALEGGPPIEPNDPGRHLDTIHLNGIASEGPRGVTFSGEQYATRLGRQEPYYAFLAAEMLTRSFVFVGSPLEEPLLWQHLAMRSLRSPESANELRPKCFLISPSLGRARLDKLRAWNIVHVPVTAEEFANHVLKNVDTAAAEGHRKLAAAAIAATDDARNIVDVASVVDA